MAPPNVDDVVVDRYELKAPLRGRAVTRTFLAHDDQIAALVAFTWFDSACVTSAAWTAFARLVEAATTARVSGLSLPRGLTPCPPDPPYCVAEVPLGQGFDRLKQIEWERALTLGERVVEILELAHAATRVAHRALTPSRLCTDRGDVRVLDFGVAEIEKSRPDDPDYRAPEQPAGDDPRVDIYTLAVILFEMISGQRPRPGQRLRDLVAVPAGVADLLARALMPEPGKRYSDYSAFRAALRAAVGLPALAPAAAIVALAPTPAPAPSKSLGPIVAPAWQKPAPPLASPAWQKPALRVPPPEDSTLQLPLEPEPRAKVVDALRPLVSPKLVFMSPTKPRTVEPPTEVLPLVLPPVRRATAEDEQQTLTFRPIRRADKPAPDDRTDVDMQRPRDLAQARRPMPMPIDADTEAIQRTAVDHPRPRIPSDEHRTAPQPDAYDDSITRTAVDRPPSISLSSVEGTKFVDDISFRGMPTPAPLRSEPAPQLPTPTLATVPVKWSTQRTLIAVNVACVVVLVVFVLIADCAT